MRIVDESSSLVYEGEKYDFDAICDGCSKWLSLIYRQYSKRGKILIMSECNEKIFFLILALLSTDRAYIPVDIKTPKERVSSIVGQVGPELIITEKKYADYFEGENLFFVDDYDNLSADIAFSNSWGAGLAYCIFTSGSTGAPKGVMVEKKAFQSFIAGTNDAIDLRDCISVLCVTSIAFDIFGFESVYALNQGKTVFLANEAQRNNPRFLKSFIIQNSIDCIQMTPSRLKLLVCVDHALQALRNVKVMIVGGEDFPLKLFSELHERLDARIYNAYGPSEATIWVSYSELTEGDINIGTPMSGTHFYLLNESGEPAEDAAVGELCIGGSNLALGYLGNEKETNARFIESVTCGERIYRTGDLCRKKNGKYYWLGRVDNQVKIQGYRIEMEEIEKILKLYKGITDAIVYLHKETDATKQYLVAVIIPNAFFEENGYRKHLTEYLPTYMIPQSTKHVGEFVYTISGKVDRKLIRQSVENG